MCRQETAAGRIDCRVGVRVTGARAGEDGVTVEMEDVESPLDEAGTVRESKVSIEYPKVAPQTAGLAGQHIEEKQAPDVIIRPSPKEHARIQLLEKENQELQNNIKQLSDQLSGA